MKKTFNSFLLLVLAAVLVFSLSACNNENANSPESSTAVSQSENPQSSEGADEALEIEKTGLWEKATYLKDTEFGSGAKTTVVEVKVEEQTVTFTIKTDKKTVGEALFEHKLIDGEDGAYGLYVKIVNGITADYDVDQSYWAFYVDGEYATSGVDTTDIKEGAIYRLEYTK